MLRQHIAKGRRSDALSSSHRHLDRSSHWRSEYERMKDANEAAEKNLADLKVENEKLKQGLEKSRSTSPVKKRKNQPDEDVILVPRSPKKQKKAGASSSFGLDAVELATSIDLNEVEEIGMSSWHMRHRSCRPILTSTNRVGSHSKILRHTIADQKPQGPRSIGTCTSARKCCVGDSGHGSKDHRRARRFGCHRPAAAQISSKCS